MVTKLYCYKGKNNKQLGEWKIAHICKDSSDNPGSGAQTTYKVTKFQCYIVLKYLVTKLLSYTVSKLHSAQSYNVTQLQSDIVTK